MFGVGGARADAFVSTWLMTVVFAGAGVATLIAGRDTPERAPWTLMGVGLVIYALGSAYYALILAGGDATFPTPADALWLAFYPFALVAIVLLVRARFSRLHAGIWLDVAIGGTVVAAIGATLVFEPVFEMTLGDGFASAARLAYPIGDLVPIGFVTVVWALGGGRVDRSWTLLGAGFVMLALADSAYVVQAAADTWAPGGWGDIPYFLAVMLIAAAAAAARGESRLDARASDTGVTVPVAFGLAAVVLATYETVTSLNPLATSLIRVTLLAVVVRLAVTLRWLARQRAHLEAVAQRDPLTGVANHRTLHERLAFERERAAVGATPLSVVVLDMDYFKRFNDTYGHQEGDAALQAIARVLVAEVAGAGIVGRVGGEEFAIVLPHAGPDAAYEIAERCRTALARLPLHGSGISCSTGVASHPDDDPEGTRLLELADGALYWAKRSGRGQSRRFDPREVVLLSSREQHEQVLTVLATPGALTPVFQPIVELATGRVAGYEALTRFLDTQPVRSPDMWFAQARRCGLGPALEARAIEVALAACDRPAGTFLSLNLSPAALLSREVFRVLPNDLSDIVIELTEDELFATGEALDTCLAALRARGARIAVDDAGAGYAGLQQLIRVKPEIVKVDRSLVCGVQEDDSRRAMLEALSRFAISTGASVCAEGIEETAEIELLGRFDIAYGQGYLLARPGPPWPAVDAEAAASAAARIDSGMRVGRSLAAGGRMTLGTVAEALAHVRTHGELDSVRDLIARLLHADDVAVSRNVPDARCVETLTSHDWARRGERFAYDDYPMTEHVVREQAIGQVIVGDDAADPAEVALLAAAGFGAALFAPAVFRAETVGLLEVYRHTARPWSDAEVDRARVVAHHLGLVALEVGAGADDGSFVSLTKSLRA